MISIETFRKLALSLPQVTEDPHFDKLSFRIKKKIFATFDKKNKNACLKLREIDQNIFILAGKTAVYPANGQWGKQGWTIFELQNIAPALFTHALTNAYCAVAPKKLAGITGTNNADE